MTKRQLSVVSVGAHQDDELGCLGTLIRYRAEGSRITTVSLSNGDKGGQHDPTIPNSVIAQTRIAEATRMAPASEISDPNRVASCAGSPIAMASTLGTSASRKSASPFPTATPGFPGSAAFSRKTSTAPAQRSSASTRSAWSSRERSSQGWPPWCWASSPRAARFGAFSQSSIRLSSRAEEKRGRVSKPALGSLGSDRIHVGEELVRQRVADDADATRR